MTKKIIYTIIVIVAVTVYAIRVYHINSTVIKAIPLQYTMGTEVAIEDDYFDSSSEGMKGYTVTVTNTDLLTIDEYQEMYGKVDEFTYSVTEYMLLVHVKFRNKSNALGSSAGINLGQYILQDKAFITYMDRDAYVQLNNLDALAFSLRYDSEKDFIIPFGINTDYIDIKQIENGSPELIVSLYPHKKSIVLR